MHDYRHLTALELLSFFVKITGGYIHKGRDARMLSYFMDAHNLGPTQILVAMYDFKLNSATKDIPTFLRHVDAETDLLEEEAELVLYLTGSTDEPRFLLEYLDLRDTGAADAVMEQRFEQARAQLKEFVDDALERPATLGSRVRAAGQRNQYRASDEDPS